MRGHTAELSNCVWNFTGNLIATGSLDATAKVWDVRYLDSYNHIFELTGHTDEVLDITFDYTGSLLATSSSDCTARVWNVSGDSNLICTMEGHCDEVSKVSFRYIMSDALGDFFKSIFGWRFFASILDTQSVRDRQYHLHIGTVMFANSEEIIKFINHQTHFTFHSTPQRT